MRRSHSVPERCIYAAATLWGARSHNPGGIRIAARGPLGLRFANENQNPESRIQNPENSPPQQDRARASQGRVTGPDTGTLRDAGAGTAAGSGELGQEGGFAGA